MAGIGLAAGIGKEAIDLAKKLTDSKKIEDYKGRLNIIKDSGKDMKNNFIGLGYGLFSKNPDCNSLLKTKR